MSNMTKPEHQAALQTSPTEITRLLLELRNGNEQAFEALTPLIYQELRAIASNFLRRESAKHTLQTTDLVHEAYLRLIDEAHFSWENRAHFFAVAARAMRQFLVFYAKQKKAQKRGGGDKPVTFKEQYVHKEQKSQDIIALDAALQLLEAQDVRLSRIVELRYFSGLTIKETAEVLSISPATVKREWVTAKAWLYREIKS